jgi:hypothetical protein
MFLKELMEGVDSDVDYSVKIDAMRIALYGHVHRLREKGQEMPPAEIWGTNGTYIRAVDVPELAQEWPDLLFFFSMDGPRQFIQLKHAVSDNITKIIMLRGAGDIDTRGVMRSFLHDQYVTVFNHEVTHLLDVKRRKRDPKEKTLTATIGDPSKYHNDSLELNAYFGELAAPLLDRLATIKTDGLEMIDFFKEVDPNFTTYLKKRIEKLSGVMRIHWNLISEKNKKRAIARLYGLHQEYMKWVAKREAEKALEPDTKAA